MTKVLSLILKLAALMALVVVLADQPGSVRIVWHDTVVETTAAFLVGAFIVISFIIHHVSWLWHRLRHGAEIWRLRRHVARLQAPPPRRRIWWKK